MNILALVPRWQEYLETGLITARPHPSLPLRVLNYTNAVQLGWLWDKKPGIEWCRGIVIDNCGNVVIWPMKKFDSSHSTFKVNTKGPVKVYDKLDGSLLLVTLWNDKLVITTRGSFESEQAIWANKFIEQNEKYENFILHYGIEHELTFLFEAIYPENRIVVNYEYSDMVLIGAISNVNGAFISPDWFSLYPGRQAEEFDFSSYTEALKASPRKNAEGYVVYFEKTGERLKIKQEDYLEMHKVVTNLSKKAIWRQMRDGTVEDFILGLPDEFYNWSLAVVENINKEFDEIWSETIEEYDSIKHIYTCLADRKKFSEAAKTKKHFHYMFWLLDEQPEKVIEHIWKTLEPKSE